jgi:hypothetical protein
VDCFVAMLLAMTKRGHCERSEAIQRDDSASIHPALESHQTGTPDYEFLGVFTDELQQDSHVHICSKWMPVEPEQAISIDERPDALISADSAEIPSEAAFKSQRVGRQISLEASNCKRFKANGPREGHRQVS